MKRDPRVAMDRRGARGISVTLLVLGLGAAIGAASQAPGPPQQPIFRTGVLLVTSDVIVRDAKGQFVPDLTKDDFEVYEDGVPQQIASVVLVHGGRVFNVQLPPPPPPQEGIILPPQRPTSDTAGRIFLLFVDDLHLDFRNTGRIRDLFKKIADTLIHDGDMFGIVSTGPSSIAIDLTYDKKRLYDAIKRISGNALRPTDIVQGPEGPEGPSEVRYRAHVAFSTAYEILQQLERVQNRRKAFVYVSNGYDFNPFPEARNRSDRFFANTFDTYSERDLAEGGNPFTTFRQGQQFADADLARELAELIRQANRANTSIYTIDPRGLVGGPDLDETEVNTTEFFDYVRKSQDSLRVLAENTGGIAVVNQNDFDRALKRIDAETSDYYVLGYYSSNPDPNKRVRQIEIKVKRPNVSVWARRSYSLKPPPAPVPSSR